MIPSLLAVVAIAACTDSVGLDLPAGCALPRACQVRGVDLVVDSIMLLVPEGHPRDGVTGQPVFQPGEPISYVVSAWNRGDARSAAVTVDLWMQDGEAALPSLDVPALDPGEAFADTVQMSAPVSLRFETDSTWFYVHHTQLHPLEDPLFANDLNRSPTFIVALPVLHATLAVPDTVREGEPFTAVVTIHNASRHGGLAPRALAFCLFYNTVGCGLSGVGSAFGLTAVPAIGPGESWTTDLVVTVSDYSPYPPFTFSLYACIAGAGSTLDDFLDWKLRQCIVDGRPVRVLDGDA